MLNLAALAPEYFAKFVTLQVSPFFAPQIAGKVAAIVAGRPRYESVANKLPGTPWYVIGIIHQLEADGDFSTHLHNGDSLKARTVNEPKGRPVGGVPPFTWEESAWDAVRYDGLHTQKDWSIAGICYALEKFNGFGYRDHGIATPYLWSGSQHYQKGKFIADGMFDPNAVSQQLGGAVILHALCVAGIVTPKASLA